jgi:hypothetical protein
MNALRGAERTPKDQKERQSGKATHSFKMIDQMQMIKYK